MKTYLNLPMQVIHLHIDCREEKTRIHGLSRVWKWTATVKDQQSKWQSGPHNGQDSSGAQAKSKALEMCKNAAYARYPGRKIRFQVDFLDRHGKANQETQCGP